MENKLLNKLIKQVNTCTRCDLHKFCKRRLIGAGNPNARIMFIGEAPGIAEDNTGIPFAGSSEVLHSECITCKFFPECFNNFINKSSIKMDCTYKEANLEEIEYNKLSANNIRNAGTIFNIMLEKAKLNRDMVYITNIVACRPIKDGYKNGKPTAEQINCCIGRVKMLLKAIQPHAVIFVGSLAARNMTDTSESMYKIVGTMLDFNVDNANYISTFMYHPASLLYSEKNYDIYMSRNVEAIKNVMKEIDNLSIWKK